MLLRELDCLQQGCENDVSFKSLNKFKQNNFVRRHLHLVEINDIDSLAFFYKLNNFLFLCTKQR